MASSRSEAKRSSPQTGEVGTESVSRSTNQDDPALLDFRRAVTEETGIEATFVDQLLDALKDAYHLGSLLKVDQILAKAIEAYDASTLDPERRGATAVASRDTLLQELENFLARHTGQDDLGLRLYGEQLAAGIRFVRMIGEGTYDVVVANPPYSGTSNLAESDYVKKHYKRGKADLYAAFLERGLQLVRKGGVSAMVTMRGWMFIKQYESLRKHLARTGDIRAIGDLDTGAFEEIGGHVVSTVLTAVWNESAKDVRNVAIRATEDYGAANKRAALLTQVGRHEFSVDALKGIEGQPLIYWWDDDFLLKYVDAVKLADVGGVRPGLQTSDNSRYLRFVWEVPAVEWDRYRTHSEQISKWVPYIKGGEAREWLEPLLYVVNWDRNGLEVKTASQFHHGSVGKRVANEKYYFNRGVAVPLLGSVFRARLHRYHSIFDVMGTSVFGTNPQETVCLLNQSTVRGILQSLNPTVHFTSGDLDKVPMWHVKTASEICDVLEREFSRHERAHESSPEFSVPGCSAWAWTQAWAQECVDRDRLQDSQSIDEPHTMTEAMSWGVGISLGRLGQEGEGWLDEAPADALPHGILYTSASDAPNSLDHPACAFLQDTWAEHGPEITTKHDLSTWLRERWFVDVHKDMYENRPIYFPLSSQNKNFVAHVSIHRWTPDTLRHLLADHLYPELRHLQGLCDDLATARAADDRATARAAEDRHATVTAWLEELTAFIADVEQCAEKGPPPTDSKCKPREVDARYAPDLDDGVMINSAALWPLLAPQWKDPAKWWKQLANETGFRGKHFDWAHLAARYWPTRVDVKCQQDPSLAVAHGTFWRYHPERAYEWELRLQHEIAPDFTIDEEGSDRHRAKFLAEHPQRSAEIHAAEMKRREKEEEKRAGLDSQGELL